jgi:hypothetical protein
MYYRRARVWLDGDAYLESKKVYDRDMREMRWIKFKRKAKVVAGDIIAGLAMIVLFVLLCVMILAITIAV